MIGSIICLIFFAACLVAFFILFNELQIQSRCVSDQDTKQKWGAVRALVPLMLSFLIFSGLAAHDYCMNIVDQRHQEQTYNIEYFDIEYDSLYVIHNGVKDSTITFKIVEYDLD